ncbi:putative F-box/FBD/LRR-repeat protein [Cardamine amara subsp. amara]|uniref:F-box/FBD/LRR-repeat protein n=1 Tax=Cardamine amara subsp. amara TaxID=228776 RepID=A0ABD0ZKN8_CARAN
MDKIIGISEDELLVKILSFLPTKAAVSTSVLSKQWKNLWKRVVKLEYDDTDSKIKPSKFRKRFRNFVKKNLQIDRESALESLYLKFSTQPFKGEDIESWVGFAVSRGVRQLSIAYSSNKRRHAMLPVSLYCCNSLVSLKLEEEIFVRIPDRVCLPSLKTLNLQSVQFCYNEEDPLRRFLPNCPVLENLTVKHIKQCGNRFSVIVPSLQSLSLEISDQNIFDEYVIDTPSLRYLKFKDQYIRRSCSIENMPKLEEADIDVASPDTKKFLEPIASVKHLSLCLKVKSAKEVYTDGIIFTQLEHLKLCTCNKYWSEVLVQLLKDSPTLRVLELYINQHSPFSSAPTVLTKKEKEKSSAPRVYWMNQLSCVPQCLMTSLESFKWIGCQGRQKEIDVYTYILNNARCLKTARVLNEVKN